MSPPTATTPPDSPFRLRVSGLGRRFDGRAVLSDTSFELGTGQVLVVTGANGAGKSTLLRIVAGLLRPTAGQVELWLDGARLPAAGQVGRIGYLAPDVHPWGELTPRENIELLARMLGRPALAAPGLEDLESFGLPRSFHRAPVGTLSTGQRQRLKLAMATLGRPPLLLLDEPGSNLDASGHETVRQAVAAARQRGAVVIATNDPDEVRLGEERLDLPRLD